MLCCIILLSILMGVHISLLVYFAPRKILVNSLAKVFRVKRERERGEKKLDYY